MASTYGGRPSKRRSTMFGDVIEETAGSELTIPLTLTAVAPNTDPVLNIANASGTVVNTFDGTGNQTASGTLQTANATVTGTLSVTGKEAITGADDNLKFIIKYANTTDILKVDTINGRITGNASLGFGVSHSLAGTRNAILGGTSNTLSGNHSLVAGGSGNTISVDDCFVTGVSNTIDGGTQNSILGGGGSTVTGAGFNNVIVGGSENLISGGSNNNSTIAGGYLNRVGTGAVYSFIGSGTNNVIETAAVDANVIGGGVDNSITLGEDHLIGGGRLNTVESTYNSTISGGYGNTIQVNGDYGTISGGFGNIVSDDYSVVCGGDNNTASGTHSVVVGGYENNATGAHSSVLGGLNNTASGIQSTAFGDSALAVDRNEFARGIGYWSTSGDRKYSEYFVYNTTGAITTFSYFLDGASEQISHVSNAMIHLVCEYLTTRDGATNAFAGRRSWLISTITPTYNAYNSITGNITAALNSAPTITVAGGKIIIQSTTTSNVAMKHMCRVSMLQWTRG